MMSLISDIRPEISRKQYEEGYGEKNGAKSVTGTSAKVCINHGRPELSLILLS